MKLAELVNNYLQFKQDLGMRFGAEGRHLRAFANALGDVDIAEVDRQQVLRYLNGKGPLTTFWHRKFEVLTGFYRFAIGRNFVAHSPLPTMIPKRPQPFVPYIYTSDEIRALLSGVTKTCSHQCCAIDAGTFRALLLLLWGTGMRLSEALQIAVADVDLSSSLLTIRDTKFFKTRLVPIDPRLSQELIKYKKQRSNNPAVSDDGVLLFFTTRHGAALSRTSVERYFRRLCNSAGVVRQDGARYQPRLHDFRHSFATDRILSWYQDGVDVQRLLPCLSTYLGHGTLAATQRYLTATPEVLREASIRFERYALEVEHD